MGWFKKKKHRPKVDPKTIVGHHEWFWDQFQKDPLQQMLAGQVTEDLGTNYRGLFQAQGARVASEQVSGMQSALAARGGGNLMSALSMGAKARSEPLLQGLMGGIQAESEALGRFSDYLGLKYGMMGQTMQGRIAQEQINLARKKYKSGLTGALTGAAMKGTAMLGAGALDAIFPGAGTATKTAADVGGIL